MTSMKNDITALSRTQLDTWLAEKDVAPFRGEQIRRWIFNAQVDSFDKMTNIKKDVRELLARPRKGDDESIFDNRGRLFPAREVGEHVGAHQKLDLVAGMQRPPLVEGIDRV